MRVSERFVAWMMLRRANLSYEEKSRVRGAAHLNYEPKRIAYALKVFFPRGRRNYQDGADESHRRHKRAGGRRTFRHAYLADDDDGDGGYDDEDEDGDLDSDISGTSNGEGEDQEDAAVDRESMLVQLEVAAETIAAAEAEGLDVYAYYQSAKKKQRAVKKARGFFKSGKDLKGDPQRGAAAEEHR